MDTDDPKNKAIFLAFMTVMAIAVFSLITIVSFIQLSGLPLDGKMSLVYDYWIAYSGNETVQKNAAISAAISGGICMALVAVLFIPKKESLYGDAKWAKEKDLKDADPCLMGMKGILIGKFNGKYLIQEGQQFTIMAAPTRSMKGVGVVIPNCLNWHESLVVTDTKLENYRITSGYRKQMGQEVYLFNPSPSDYKTHRWNPLSYISDDPNFRIDDVQKIAEFILPSPKSGDPMWSSEGRKLLLGIILYISDSAKSFPVTLGEVYRQLHTEKEISDYFEDILEEEGDDLDPQCHMALGKFANMPSKQREGVVSTLSSAINLWANPLLDAATADNDFDLRDIRRRKMTIYIGLSPDNLDRMAPVVNLFFQQLVDLNTRGLPDKVKEPYSTLLLMDEFPAFGRMPTISKGVSYMAGYNLRLLPIIQSTEQLRDIYGPEVSDNFIKNHATRIVYAPKTHREAEEIANEVGFKTATSESISKPRDFGKGMGSRSVSKTKRHLILPQEVKAIGKKAEIIISENCRPVKAKKIIYFKDENFLKRCIKPENMKAVKSCRDQETFLTLVKDYSPVPTIDVQHYEMRGRKPREIDLDFDSVEVPETEETFTDEDIDQMAEDFFKMTQAS